jgi:hypothetical protein
LLKFDTLDSEDNVNRQTRERICEAERRIRENSPGWLRHEYDTLRRYQQKSLEPEIWQVAIDEIERKLKSSQDQGVKDFWVYVSHEKDGLSWQQIGDRLYPSLKGQEKLRARARRAWDRANRKLEPQPITYRTADAMIIGILNFSLLGLMGSS